jgi:GLPGLI family protein
MISMAGIKNWALCILWIGISATASAQITEGRIVYERKVNLKKLFGDDERMKNFITDENKIRIEQFELLFNDSLSAFLPIPSEDDGNGFMKYLTSHNKVYYNRENEQKMVVMDMWGNETFMLDTMQRRAWKVTESKRNIGGYQCRKAIWEMNDSTRIYAWFSVDVVPSIGPEGFAGLPGAILGLATEDGGIIYFAKEVTLQQPKAELLTKDPGKSEVFSKAKLRAILEEKMGRWMKKEDLDGMFSWL